MSVINTNINSLISRQALDVNSRSLSKAMEQLSTGRRINSAADDAAGLAIADKMTAQIRGLNQAVRNANDAISMLQTAEGATQSITDMLQRMRELAVQASNGTYSSADLTSLQDEYDDLNTEIERIAGNTEWNEKTLLDGTYSASGISFQVGAGSASAYTISVTFSDLSSLSGIGSADITSDAGSAIDAIDTAIATVDTFRSDLGSKINRLNYAADNLTNIATNTAASRSRILDTDYAAATTELARTQIIQQAATAMLAQANQQPQMVLSLLK